MWLFPSAEEVMESGDSIELGVAGGGGSIGDGVRDGIKAVDNDVGWCDRWDGEIVVTEVNCVGDAKVEGLGFRINDAIASVMLKGYANIESVRAMEVPGAASDWLVMDDDKAAEW